MYFFVTYCFNVIYSPFMYLCLLLFNVIYSTFMYLCVLLFIVRVRGTALSSVKEAMTKGLLLSTILPTSIPPSTTLPPIANWGVGGLSGGRVVKGWIEGRRLVNTKNTTTKNGRKPSVMAYLTEVRAAPRTL